VVGMVRHGRGWGGCAGPSKRGIACPGGRGGEGALARAGEGGAGPGGEGGRWPAGGEAGRRRGGRTARADPSQPREQGVRWPGRGGERRQPSGGSPGRRAGAAREAGISRRADGPLREQICICQLSAPRETTGGECGSDLVLGKVTGKPEPMQRAWAARSGSEQVDDAGRWLL